MFTILEIKRVHTDTASKRGRFAQLCFDIIHSEMLNRSREPAFKLHTVRHFVHHLSKYTYI